jgi:hypothetical protein
MRELTKRSQELQDSILRNQALLGELSERIAQVLDGKVKMPEDQAYVFVPRVYRRPLFLPEIFMAAVDTDRFPFPRPEPGPYDPWIVKILDKERLAVSPVADPDPTPWKDLREQILADRVLFADLSDAIAETLEKHGIALDADETYAFEAVMGPKPLFSSQLSALPIPLPRPRRGLHPGMAAHAHVQQQVGVHFVTPWDKGIPAPEILVALERLRLDRG